MPPHWISSHREEPLQSQTTRLAVYSATVWYSRLAMRPFTAADIGRGLLEDSLICLRKWRRTIKGNVGRISKCKEDAAGERSSAHSAIHNNRQSASVPCFQSTYSWRDVNNQRAVITVHRILQAPTPIQHLLCISAAILRPWIPLINWLQSVWHDFFSWVISCIICLRTINPFDWAFLRFWCVAERKFVGARAVMKNCSPCTYHDHRGVH